MPLLAGLTKVDSSKVSGAIFTVLLRDHSEVSVTVTSLACALTLYVPGLDQECEALGEDDQLE